MRAAFPCPFISIEWILVHEHPCCRNSTFNHTPETYLFNTLSLINVSDDLLGNWAHDCVKFWLNARYLVGINFFRLDRSCSASWVSHPRVLIAQQLLIVRIWLPKQKLIIHLVNLSENEKLISKNYRQLFMVLSTWALLSLGIDSVFLYGLCKFIQRRI